MDALRTPDDRFADVVGFDHPTRLVDVGDGLQMCVAVAGPSDAPTVVLVHGEPTWGYLYRDVVTPLLEAGLRVVVPDLIGCGRSDKPTRREDCSYARHVEWLRAALFDSLGLPQVFYVGQDWGGLLGMRLLAEHPERFAGVVMSNTGLPTGDVPMPDEWQRFRRMVETAPTLDVPRMVDSGCVRALTDAELDAYAAPFPSEDYCAGIRVFPSLVPNYPDDPAYDANTAAWEALSTCEVPLLCAFTDSDPVTRGSDEPMRERIPGAAGQDHVTIKNAGHFVQEDAPAELAHAVLGLVRSV